MVAERLRQTEFPWLPNWLPKDADPFGYPDSLIRARVAAAYEEGISRIPISGRRVLDYGSLYGHGALRLWLKKPEVVVSSDRHTRRLQGQRQIFNEVTDIRYVKLEAPYVPFLKNTFDAIFFNHVLEHIEKEKLPQLLANLKRALCPEGALVVATPNVENLVASNPLDNKVYSYEELEFLLGAYFDNVTILSLVPNDHASSVHKRKKLLASLPGARVIREHMPKKLQEVVLGSGERRVRTKDFVYIEGYDSRAIDFLALAKGSRTGLARSTFVPLSVNSVEGVKSACHE